MSFQCKKVVHHGFTLIELLVVIAVIGLLTAILIPALAVAKERARRVICSKNVNQFVVGCLMYAEGYDEDLPSGKSDMGNGNDEHTPVIRRSVGNAMAEILGDYKVMKCPWLGEPFNGDEWWYYDGYGYVLGYNYLGGHQGTPWTGPSSGLNVKEWKSPQFNTDSSTCVLVAELNFWVPGDRTFAPHGSRGPINQYIESGSGGMTPQEAGAVGGNVGMLDGSVTWKKIDQMQVYHGSRMQECYAVW